MCIKRICVTTVCWSLSKIHIVKSYRILLTAGKGGWYGTFHQMRAPAARGEELVLRIIRCWGPQDNRGDYRAAGQVQTPFPHDVSRSDGAFAASLTAHCYHRVPLCTDPLCTDLLYILSRLPSVLVILLSSNLWLSGRMYNNNYSNVMSWTPPCAGQWLRWFYTWFLISKTTYEVSDLWHCLVFLFLTKHQVFRNIGDFPKAVKLVNRESSALPPSSKT